MPRLSFALLALFAALHAHAAEVAPAPRPVVRVAVYVGTGTSASKAAVLDTLRAMPGVAVDELTEADVRDGKLGGYKLVVFPGGTGGGQGKALGDDGRERVRAFVRGGGGYVGICAGSYLASRSYDWSLGLLDAEVVDRKHWARGYGDVELAVTPSGKGLLGAAADTVGIYYHQGPLLAPGNDPAIPDYTPLAAFRTEIAKNGAPAGVMKGTTAVAAGAFGAGKVVCFSPHPEKNDATRELLRKAVAWAAAR